MKLGTAVAAIKLKKKGAREGLPYGYELNEKFRVFIDEMKNKE